VKVKGKVLDRRQKNRLHDAFHQVDVAILFYAVYGDISLPELMEQMHDIKVSLHIRYEKQDFYWRKLRYPGLEVAETLKERITLVRADVPQNGDQLIGETLDGRVIRQWTAIKDFMKPGSDITKLAEAHEGYLVLKYITVLDELVPRILVVEARNNPRMKRIGNLVRVVLADNEPVVKVT
jgi:hypothetical protein